MLKIIGLLLVCLAIAFFLGPRPDNSQTISFDPASLPQTSGSDLDAFLAASEARFADIRPGMAKEIVWAHPLVKDQTEYAIVYVHGFSATKVETAPVPQNLARAFGANLYLTRLSGHGRSGDAMAEPKMSDWLNDTVEALEIGKKLGRKTILVSASTGSTLATWAASRPEYAANIAGMIMISPNYALHAAPNWLLNMPWGETILPLALGAERSFKPVNEGHAAGWTHTYPSRSVFPMGALLRTVEEIDPASIGVPTLFIYSNKDKVVVSDVTKSVISKWGGQKDILEVDDSVDPYSHVIAGDILSPNTTARVSNKIIEWARTLKK